ncbi:NERD domain-containing protein [Vibrio cholerae]|uniref:nuclease-related domain-containing DEAD/DEAH box helicase n=1 Tax=Vibrio cholerae TaxID=666 RepID=UPI0028DA1588|nr:AAA family ATPase [Vibrio cholerae]HDL9454364.1 AAA family ATPase [Vibrio cholerae]HDZ9478215.1 AAA family ATPase [Vibrio cholerae]
MATIYPSLENISRLKVKPTEGELWIVNYLNENLDESYEVFFNPFLDGDRPDIIILKKDVAIFVIEVKDYELKNYNVDGFNKWSVISHQGSNPISSPQSQAFTYKNNLYQLHLPVLGLGYLSNRNFFNLVQPLVYFHKANKSEIDEFYKNAENENRESARLLFEQKKANKIAIEQYNRKADGIGSSRKKLSRDKAMSYGSDMLPNLVRKIKSYGSHILFDERVYDDFKRRLMPCDHVLKQGKKIPLDAKQEKLTVSSECKEKIKGVAGCGKTTIIAHRAVNAHTRHDSKVLIITYNITLKNLIKDRISDVLGYRDNENYAVTNYHQFFNSQLNATGQDIERLIGEYGLEKLYSTDLFKDHVVEKYQTILLDEVQDFESDWVKIIRDNFLANEGEMVLFGDESQNIYARDNERAAVVAQGFGRWNKLKRSYRTSLDSSLNQVFKAFQQKYLVAKYSDTELLETAQTQLGMTFELLKYHQLNQNWENEAFELIQAYVREQNLHPNDIVILASNVYLARRLVDKFNGIENTHCMFETYDELAQLSRMYDSNCDAGKLKSMSEIELNTFIKKYPKLKQDLERARRMKKNHFYANSGLIKASTIHSFKGLESKTVFYLMDEKDTPELVYTSITRAAENLVILDKSDTSQYSDFFSGAMNNTGGLF